MNAREQTRFDAVKRAGDFGTNNAIDYTTARPPAAVVTPGQTQAKQLFDDLNTPKTGLIARIGDNAEVQQSSSGGFHSGTTSKGTLRDALFTELKGFNRTAAAIAKSKKNPAIMEKFRMPYGVSDILLPAKAAAMGQAAGALQADFIAHGHDATFVADLSAHIADFEAAGDDQSGGEQGQAGATAGFGPLLESAMTKLTQLDAFMHNFYKADMAKLGEWHTASHVERAAKKTAKPAAPAAGGSPTPPTP